MSVNKLDKVYYPPPVEAPMEQKMRDASKMYERQFLKEMVKAMRSTVPEGGMIQVSNGEKIFREQLDDEYVDKWTDRGGIGMADMIYDQLMQKFGGQNLKIKPTGPLDMRDAEVFKGKAVSPKPQQMDFTFSREMAAAGGRNPVVEIQSPYDGVLRAKVPVENGYLLKIEHDNGFTSQLHFRGTSPGIEKGQKIQAGQRIGLLSPDAQEFFWSLGERSPKSSEELGGPASL